MTTVEMRKVPRAALMFDAPKLAIRLKKAREDDPEATTDATLSGVAYSGEVVNHWWWGRSIFDLSTTSAREDMPILYGHSDTSELGQADEVTIDDAIRIEATIYNLTEEATKVIKYAARGFKWRLSIGAQPGWIEEIPANAKTKVNGREIDGPLAVFKNSEIFETSITSIPVDGKADAQVHQALGEEISIRVEKGDVRMKTAEQLQQEIEELRERFEQVDKDWKAASEENTTLKQALKQTRDGARLKEVKALFTSLGRDVKDDELSAYVSMSDEQFTRVSADMLAGRPKLDPALFSATPKSGTSATEDENPAKRLAAEMAQNWLAQFNNKQRRNVAAK